MSDMPSACLVVAVVVAVAVVVVAAAVVIVIVVSLVVIPVLVLNRDAFRRSSRVFGVLERNVDVTFAAVDG